MMEVKRTKMMLMVLLLHMSAMECPKITLKVNKERRRAVFCRLDPIPGLLYKMVSITVENKELDN
jgi:hypothetical protein